MDLTEQALHHLQKEETDAAWKILESLPHGTPNRDLYRACCLDGYGVTVSALLCCDEALRLFPDDARAKTLGKELERRISQVTYEGWRNDVEFPRLTVIIYPESGTSPNDWYPMLRSLFVQRYPNLRTIIGLPTTSAQSDWHQLTARLSIQDMVQFCVAPNALELVNRAALDPEELLCIVEKPSIVQLGALRSIAELAIASGELLQWATSHRVYTKPSLLNHACSRSIIQWSEEFFLDQKRFRHPRAELALQDIWFRAPFLTRHLQTAKSKNLPCLTTTLCATCLAEIPPLAISTALISRLSVTDAEPTLTPHEVAAQVQTLAFLRRRRALPNPQTSTVVRIQTIDQESLETHQLFQLPRVSVTGTLPKISVVVPNFNRAHLLELCLSSIVEQKYPNLELIVQDGGSTDGSIDVINRFRSQISALSIGPDAGHYAAVHTGMRAASGEIVTWINSTDLLTPWSLHTAAAVFMTRPDVRWLTGRVSLLSISGLLTQCSIINQYSRRRYLEGKFDNPWIQQEGTYMRRSLWIEAGNCLDLSFQYAADLELWARLFRHAHLFSTTAVLGTFRYHEGQRSEQGRQEYYQEALEILERERGVVAWHSDGSARIPEDAPEPILSLANSASATTGGTNDGGGGLRAQVSVEQSSGPRSSSVSGVGLGASNGIDPNYLQLRQEQFAIALQKLQFR